MPVKRRGEINSQRHANDGRNRKRGHYCAHRRAASFHRNNVADNGENHSANYAAEGARKKPRRHEQFVSARKTAKQRSNRETEKQEQQRALAVKSVEPESRYQSEDTRADAVGRNNQPEL